MHALCAGEPPALPGQAAIDSLPAKAYNLLTMRHRPTSRLCFIALIFCASWLPLLAQQSKYPAYAAHINDFANVIDANTKSQLETILTNFEQRSGAQIAVATIQTLGGTPIEDYANGMYRAWGIGAKAGPNKDKGALLLVVTQDKRSRMEVGYVLEGDLPDGLAGEQLRRMRPYFQQQQWSQGVNAGVRTLVDTLAQKWNINLDGIDRSFAYQPQPAEPDVKMSPMMIIFGIIFVLFLLFLMNRGGRGGGGRGGGSGWWIAPMIFHQGGGGFGGSSWGNGGGWGGNSGGGGGGSWGGFGGGSSGGGGASDSW